MNEPWIQQLIVGGVLVGGLGFFIRMWITGIDERYKHIDTCIDSLRSEMRTRVSGLDRLIEWREHRDKDDERWHQEWQRHLARLDEDARTDQERRHKLGDQIQTLINKVHNLERERAAKVGGGGG